MVKLKSSIRKFYDRHHDLVNSHGIFVLQMTTDIHVPCIVITIRSFVTRVKVKHLFYISNANVLMINSQILYIKKRFTRKSQLCVCC